MGGGDILPVARVESRINMHSIKAAIRGQPNVAKAVFYDTEDAIGRKAVHRCELDPLVCAVKEPARHAISSSICDEPKIPSAIWKDEEYPFGQTHPTV